MTKPAQYEATLVKHPLIHGVKTKPLRLIPDERGWLLEILRADDTELFTKFGQVYVSATYPGVVKAWHYHKHQVDNFACVAGMIKLVLVDTRVDSPTSGAVNEFFIGTQNSMLVQVPVFAAEGGFGVLVAHHFEGLFRQELLPLVLALLDLLVLLHFGLLYQLGDRGRRLGLGRRLLAAPNRGENG